VPIYTADQLRAYAAQAVAQEREREFETRADGKVVRKDRWEWGVRRIAAMFFGNRREWEIDDVVEAVRKVAPTEHADDVETIEGFHKQFAGSPSPQPAPDSKPTRVEYLLRRLLAHRVAGVRGYYDDGELQDTTMHPFIDFLRDHPKGIELKLGERGRAAAASQPSSIVATTGFAQVIDGPKEPGLQWDEAPQPVAYRYWKDKFACWEYSDKPLEFPAVPAGTAMEPLYLNPPPPSAGEEKAG
jgi:hypothetical protein